MRLETAFNRVFAVVNPCGILRAAPIAMKTSKYTPGYKVWEHIFDGVFLVSLIATALVAVIPKLDAKAIASLPEDLARVVEWLGPRVVGVLWVLATFTAIAKMGKSWLESRWVWALGQSLVDNLCKDCFAGIDGNWHEHRVTLFQHRRLLLWIWPWRRLWWPWGMGRGPTSGWLVPVLRSGHTTQKSRTVFLAPDDAQHAEGVAGKTWATRNREIVVDNLPEPDPNVPGSVVDYAKRTGVSEEWLLTQILDGRQMARAFRAIPVEVGGRRWGVLLTRQPRSRRSG
jgi:hypothetical protein